MSEEYPVLRGPALVEAARTLARKAHEGQFRRDKVTPYITHPEAVANLFHIHWTSTDVWNRYERKAEDDYHRGLALCWAHDLLEDCNVTIDDLRLVGWDFLLAQQLLILTRPSSESYLDYILGIKEHARNVGVLPLFVKLCDMEHNSQTASGSQLAKYQLATHILTT